MRSITLILSILFATHALSLEEQSWFSYNPIKNTYTIHHNKVQPSQFFRSLSLHSGIEIIFDSTLIEYISVEFKDASLKEILNFIDRQYSTLHKYLKDSNGQDHLTSFSVLPKGQYQSNNMILALDPVNDTIAFKQEKSTNSSAQIKRKIRRQHLNERLIEKLDEVSESEIMQKKLHIETIEQIEKEKDARKEMLIEELTTLQQTHPDIYKHRISVLKSRYPKIEQQLADLESENSK